MASTGLIESWNVDPAELGPIYPFTGWTVFMFVACVGFCVGFMVWKFVTENAGYAARAVELRDSEEMQNRLSADNSNHL